SSRCFLSFYRFFSFSLPAPHFSSSFPYTTLFRSRFRSLRAFAFSIVVLCPDHGSHPSPTRKQEDRRRVTNSQTRSHGRSWLICRDRKSTRLNSSHRTISYAVFCLKKKKMRRAEPD